MYLKIATSVPITHLSPYVCSLSSSSSPSLPLHQCPSLHCVLPPYVHPLSSPSLGAHPNAGTQFLFQVSEAKDSCISAITDFSPSLSSSGSPLLPSHQCLSRLSLTVSIILWLSFNIAMSSHLCYLTKIFSQHHFQFSSPS